MYWRTWNMSWMQKLIPVPTPSHLDFLSYRKNTMPWDKTEASLIIQQTEIFGAAYNKWYLQVFLLLSAFICGYGYGLDGNIRYIYTGYATSSYSEHSLLSTINVINAVVSAASQIIYARLSDVFGRLYLFISAVILYVVGTIIQSQASLWCSKVRCRCYLLQRRLCRCNTHSFDHSIRFFIPEMETAISICTHLAFYHQHVDCW